MLEALLWLDSHPLILFTIVGVIPALILTVMFWE